MEEIRTEGERTETEMIRPEQRGSGEEMSRKEVI